jgi:hypothetical protein
MANGVDASQPPGVGEGEAGVRSDRTLEVLDTGAEAALAQLRPVVATEEVELVGLDALGGLPLDPRPLLRRELRLQRRRDLLRHVALDREDLREVAVVGLDPEVFLAPIRPRSR